MRYALCLEYDGAGFLGWQSQRQTPTVQDTLETALSRVADHDVSVVCAGRTDTGVHARGQVVHFNSHAERSARSWLLGVNSNLPDAVSALWIHPVSEDFHARFSAFERSYRYSILNRWIRPALGRGEVAWVRRPLDAGRMHRALQSIKGEHDFSAFRSSGCKARHAIRNVLRAEVSREGDRIQVSISANGFLYHMVRNLVGSLLEIGAGDRAENWMAELLAAGDRKLAGVTAPASGLCFMAVRYPSEFNLPSRVAAFPREAGQ